MTISNVLSTTTILRSFSMKISLSLIFIYILNLPLFKKLTFKKCANFTLYLAKNSTPHVQLKTAASETPNVHRDALTLSTAVSTVSARVATCSTMTDELAQVFIILHQLF